MPAGSGKPTSPNLGEVLEGLMEAGVESILVGGLAPVIQGAPVTTLDVDIVHSQSAENIARLLSFLKSVDAFHRRTDKLIEPKEDDLSGKGHGPSFTTRLGPLYVLNFIEEEKSYSDLLDHTVEIDFTGPAIRLLDLKMLIQLERTSTDPRDKQRLPVLKETLRQREEEYGSGQENHDGNGDDE